MMSSTVVLGRCTRNWPAGEENATDMVQSCGFGSARITVLCFLYWLPLQDPLGG